MPRPPQSLRMRLLVVEDDLIVLNIECRVLTGGGYLVESAATAAEALAQAAQNRYDGILLDMSLPDVGGLEVLRTLRARGDFTPVLFVTGQSSETMIARVLNAGADDYVVKPITAEHLLARVRSLLRRQSGVGVTNILQVVDVQLNRLAHRLLHARGEIELSRKEYALIEYFFLRPDVLVTRAELLEQVWGTTFDPGTNLIDVHMARVRRLLEETGTAVEIRTRRGIGFELCTPKASVAR